jgi:hypothetical protein
MLNDGLKPNKMRKLIVQKHQLKQMIMETNDLGDKKINNEQELNEGFSSDFLPENYDPSEAKLKADLEIDQEGNHKMVQRATYNDEQIQRSSNENAGRDIERKSEHKDRNADVAANRYPNSHPDNHHDRGNMNLDE